MVDEMIGMPVGERVRYLAAFHATGKPELVASVLDHTGGAELRELASVALTELSEARSELADLREGQQQ